MQPYTSMHDTLKDIKIHGRGKYESLNHLSRDDIDIHNVEVSLAFIQRRDELEDRQQTIEHLIRLFERGGDLFKTNIKLTNYKNERLSIPCRKAIAEFIKTTCKNSDSSKASDRVHPHHGTTNPYIV